MSMKITREMIDLMSRSKNPPTTKINEILKNNTGLELEKKITILFADWTPKQPIFATKSKYVDYLESLSQEWMSYVED